MPDIDNVPYPVASLRTTPVVREVIEIVGLLFAIQRATTISELPVPLERPHPEEFLTLV